MMTAKEIRESYKKFFEQQGHLIVPSAPMVIKDDPTLMFTNAGMNPWKGIILGNDPIQYPRVADSQKCLRVSGKHNDLEEVGHDTYHHTMFEMLGNWSFGDYFKQGAIDMAWEYLVDVLKLDPKNLYVTVFEGSPEEGIERDNEAASIWAKHLPADHILDGNKHDNFWEMGDTGPCGPCSEIHVDSRSEEEKAAISGRELVNKDHPQVIEIWNLVFMQYNRKADGSLDSLPYNVIDTGMGFERLVRSIQGKNSNYDTDIFQPLIQVMAQKAGIKYGDAEETDVAMRVIVDHLRAIAFSIADGQLPGNAKAGYVIRRILRRAVRYGYTFLGQKQAFMYSLVPALIQEMGSSYPELEAQKELIMKVMKEEEDSFLRTLENGIRLLNGVMEETRAAGKTVIAGDKAFTLFDTFGFPLDLTELICRENGMTVDVDGNPHPWAQGGDTAGIAADRTQHGIVFIAVHFSRVLAGRNIQPAPVHCVGIDQSGGVIIQDPRLFAGLCADIYLSPGLAVFGKEQKGKPSGKGGFSVFSGDVQKQRPEPAGAIRIQPAKQMPDKLLLPRQQCERLPGELPFKVG